MFAIFQATFDVCQNACTLVKRVRFFSIRRRWSFYGKQVFCNFWNAMIKRVPPLALSPVTKQILYMNYLFHKVVDKDYIICVSNWQIAMLENLQNNEQ